MIWNLESNYHQGETKTKTESLGGERPPPLPPRHRHTCIHTRLEGRAPETGESLFLPRESAAGPMLSRFGASRLVTAKGTSPWVLGCCASSEMKRKGLLVLEAAPGCVRPPAVNKGPTPRSSAQQGERCKLSPQLRATPGLV